MKITYIRDYRKRSNLTQAELAERMGVHENTIRRWEAGDFEPRSSELLQLCKILNCSETELLNGPSDGKIQVTISYDWSKFEKGEINMDGNLFEIFLGKLGEIGIKGAGLPKTYAEKEELKRKICADIDSAFEVQIRRGAIQPA